MATYYFRNTGSQSWGTAANWSLTSGGGATGAVPTVTDAAILDVYSGSCTMNVSGVCSSINFSTYANTLTMTNGLAVSGNITLDSGMTITGAGALTINSTSTVTSNGKIWPNNVTTGNLAVITFADTLIIGGTLTLGANTLTLNADLYCSSILATWNATQTQTINGAYTLYCGYYGNVGSFTFGAVGGGSIITGTATIEIGGQGGVGFITNTQTALRTLLLNINFTFNFKGVLITQDNLAPPNFTTANAITGNVITSLLFVGSTNTYTYKAGNIITKNVYGGLGGTLFIGGGTFINFDKIPFGYVIVTNNTSPTFNRFFSGSAKVVTQIGTSDPTVATANYTIQFQDDAEKISYFIKINNCTVAKPGQLLISYRSPNKGRNIGIRYFNQLPDGIPRKTPILPNNLTGTELVQMTGGIASDPTRV